MSWRYWSVRTNDWSTKVRVYPTAFSWGRALNAGKGGTASFLPGELIASNETQTATPTNLAPWSRMLVAEWQGLILYAGFITGTEYDRGTQQVSVSMAELHEVLGRRLMADTVSAGVQTRALVYTGVTLVQLAKNAVVEGNNDATRFNLPIALPADEVGTVNRTYEGHELPTVASILNDLMGTEGGPDIDFFPRWRTDDSVEWLMRVGANVDGAWSWDVTAPQSGVTGLRYRTDGARMANRIAAVGEGSGKNMLVSVVDGSNGSSFLPLDASPAFKDEHNQARLDARARAELAARGVPTKQVSMDVFMDEDFAAHQLRLGGTVSWYMKGDPWIPDGWHASRLVEFSGDMTAKVHLEFQEA